jgi:branched-chain amino acid transport system permease protein
VADPQPHWLAVLGTPGPIAVDLGELGGHVLNGLGMGAIFAFIALGYTMVYGIIKLINFAHGEFFMVGAFTGYFVLRDLELERLDLPQPLPVLLPFLAALTAASRASGTLAVVTERLAYRPVRRAGRIAALLTAVGVSLLLQNLAIQAWGAAGRGYPDPRTWVSVDAIPDPADANYWVRRVTVTTVGATVTDQDRVIVEGQPVTAQDRQRLREGGHAEVYRRITLSKETMQGFVLLALALWAPVLWFLVKRTRLGKAMRAVSEDHDAARLMGIPIDRVVSATFFLGAFVAGVGGVAYCATYGQVEPLTGFLPGLKAFVAAVIGGIGSIPGAILGGLILGVTEGVVPYLLREAGWEDALAWKHAIAFAFLILILLLKPTGLLGKAVREKV